MPLPSNPVAGAYIAISPPTIDDAQVVPPCPGNAVAAHSRWGASAQLKPLAVFDGSLHGPDGTGGVSMGALESAEFHRISRRKSRFDPGANTSGNRPRRCWLRRPPLCSPCWPCPRGDGPSLGPHCPIGWRGPSRSDNPDFGELLRNLADSCCPTPKNTRLRRGEPDFFTRRSCGCPKPCRAWSRSVSVLVDQAVASG